MSHLDVLKSNDEGIEESEDLTNARSQVQNAEPDNLELNSELKFCVQTLNEVFKVWCIDENDPSVKCQTFRKPCSNLELQSIKKDTTSVEKSESLPKDCDTNEQYVKDVLDSASSQICDNSSPCSKGPEKFKSSEKRRKMKKTKEKNSCGELMNCQASLGERSENKMEDCTKSTCSENLTSSTIDSSQSSKNENKPRKKKSSFDQDDNHKLFENVSVDLEERMNLLCDMLCLNDATYISDTNSSVGTPGVSQTINEQLNNNSSEKDVGRKTQKEIFQEQKKIVKKEKKKQDGSDEFQNKDKKKVKHKKKVVRNSTIGSDVTDDSGIPSPIKTSPTDASPKKSAPKKSSTKKTPSKDQKKTIKPFEDYWSIDAVKEGMRNGAVIEGSVRINPKRFTEAYVSSPTGGQDILIDGLCDRNRALDGDLVAVLLNPPSEWKTKKQGNGKSKADVDLLEISKDDDELIDDSIFIENDMDQKPQVTGKVVAILVKHHPRKCAGYLKLIKPNDKNALFSPRDARVPRIKIHCDKCPADFRKDPASKKGVLYLARILEWTTGVFAKGEIVKQIGEMGNLEAETEAILLDNDLDVSPLPEDDCKKFTSESYAMDEEEIAKREDLRKECIFTIDPATAKDLDDAVSCKELENGNLEIGVHISDVTYYLEENTDLDNEVTKRATSIYLVDKVYHMLPLELCLLCSLLPGEDKFAYSVIWEISKDDAKIVSQRIVRSVIHSCTKLAYEHAQNVIENPEKEWNEDDFPPIDNGFSPSDISRTVKNLQMIAVKLRKRRFDDGALRIDQTKLFIELDSFGMPAVVSEYINKESHRLIEEFMLLANMATGKFIYEKFPDIAFLRCHHKPHEFPLKQLQNSMASRGIHLSINNAGDLQSSLTRYSGVDFFDKTRLMVLNALCARTMTRARYFCSGGIPEEEFWHYALSVPFYTHFTSPIRRYADIMVHRLLNAALGYSSKPSWTEEHVSEIAANCNKKKHSAKLAGEQSIKLYLSIYIKNHQPVIEDAVVVDVKDYSFDIIVIKFGLTMRVYVTKLDVIVECDPEERTSPMKITWKPTENRPQPTVQIVDVFTLVKVKIQTDQSLKLEAKLIRPKSELLASSLCTSDLEVPALEITSSGPET